MSFGIIGTGGRGVYVGIHMASDANARLGAICDIYPDRIDQRARPRFPGPTRCRAFKDLNELLAQPDIDAVLIATPDQPAPRALRSRRKSEEAHLLRESPRAPASRA